MRHAKDFDYRTGRGFFVVLASTIMLQCDNRARILKRKRVTVRRGNHLAHVLGLKFRAGFTRARARRTQGFSLEKFTKVHHGN